MKKLLFLLVAMLVGFASAGDVYTKTAVYLNASEGEVPLASALGNAVASYEDGTVVTYVWRTTFIDSSNNRHSPPIYVGGLNASDGFISIKGSATGDVNPILHFSPDDKTTWFTAVTVTDMDASSSTFIQDTLGYNDGSDDLAFHNARWLVVELASGSATNADGNIYTFTVTLKKPDGAGFNDNGTIRKLSKVGSTNRVDP